MVENLPNFRQNLSAFVRGWQLVAVGVTSSRMTAGYSPGRVLVQTRHPLVDSNGLLSKLVSK